MKIQFTYTAVMFSYEHNLIFKLYFAYDNVTVSVMIVT